ncbi:MAG: response regulator [Chloroflexota bacterium]
MTTPNILVIDSDEGFGTMLQEGLVNSGYYTATCVNTGKDAIRAFQKEAFDLVIIDIAITDVSPLKLAQGLQKAKDGIRIMLIPLMGQDVPEKMKDLKVDGILSKPFFVGDLPDLVDAALGRSRAARPAPAPPAAPDGGSSDDESAASPAEEASTPAPVVPAPAIASVPQETVRYLRANESEVLRLLNDLNREVRAEAILLIAGHELIAQAGILGRDQCQELTILVAQSSQAAAQAAKFLGESAGRFAQGLHEGSEYRLYTLTLADGMLLSLALSSNVPLGMIRHQCRQTAEKLTEFI